MPRIGKEEWGAELDAALAVLHRACVKAGGPVSGAVIEDVLGVGRRQTYRRLAALVDSERAAKTDAGYLAVVDPDGSRWVLIYTKIPASPE